jgi:signal transduction histidine kinase
LKDKFFSIVAHDLRNPVNSVQNISDALANDYDEINDSDKAELAGILQKSANKLTDLISNLFTWSTFQQGIISYSPTNFNVTKSLNENIEILKRSAADKHVVLNHAANSDLDIFADKKMVDSIIVNLITNAIKFSSPDSIVTISAREKDSLAEILIEDSGTGIPEDIQASLFKIDETKSLPGTDGEKGTGLGLLICKEFVEINNGNIWFESEVGVGSKFFVSFPLAEKSDL